MRINITMPVYNTPPNWLRRAVNSVLCQTQQCWKLLMLNDGSTNVDTVELLDQIKFLLPEKIKVIDSPINEGIAVTRNKLLDHLDDDCEFVALFDHDDVMYNDRLEKQLRYFETHDVDFLGGQIDPGVMDDMDNTVWKPWKSTTHPLIITKRVVTKSGWFMNNPTVMLKRNVYDKVGKYNTRPDINLTGTEDYEFIIRCVLAGMKIHNLPDALVKYRLSQTQAGSKNTDLAKKIGKEIFDNFMNQIKQQNTN